MARDTVKNMYEDTGCEFAPLCQECPLPRCKHDYTTDQARNTFNYGKRKQIDMALVNQLLVEGKKHGQIAKVFGVSRSTISSRIKAEK